MENLFRHILAIHPEGVEPGEVVKPPAAHCKALAFHPQQGRQLLMEAAGRIANAIDHIITLRAQRLRDQPARIGKIENQHILFRKPFRQLAVAREDRDAAQCHRKAARACRLLAEHTVIQRRAFIKDAALVRVAPDCCDDIVRVPDGLLRIRRQGKSQCRVAPLADQLGDLPILP